MTSIKALSEILGAKECPSSHEQELIKKAQKAAKILSYIPGIRMIGLCNSLSYYGGNEQSDIDLFIVSTPELLWFVRAFSTLAMKFFGMRRYGENTEWLVCLSFFATTNALDLWKIAIESDYYLAYWIAHLRPLISHENTYEIFREKNIWIESLDLEFLPKQEAEKYKIDSVYLKNIEFFGACLWNFLNSIIFFVFWKKKLQDYETKKLPWGVIISKDILKFHPDDRRVELRNKIISILSSKK